MSRHPIHLITALSAEAKPVIAHFGLKRLQPDCGFPVYRNRHIALVISGVGKANAAAAVALLQARSGCPEHAVWLNLGIAGHADMPLGRTVLANKVTDAANDESRLLPMEFDPPCPTPYSIVELTTLDRPDFDYRRDGAFDMEASGFCAAALRFSPPGLVHCFKVISDNRKEHGRGISGARVRVLIGQHLELLEQLTERLTVHADRLTTGNKR